MTTQNTEDKPAECEPVACNTDTASVAIAEELRARGYPSNPENAARAGWDACLRVNTTPQPAECEPVAIDQLTLAYTSEGRCTTFVATKHYSDGSSLVFSRHQMFPGSEGCWVVNLPNDAAPQPCPRCAELEQDLQTNADALAEVEQIRDGLRNCRLFAARHRNEAWALLILGFCAEAGEVGSILR